MSKIDGVGKRIDDAMGCVLALAIVGAVGYFGVTIIEGAASAVIPASVKSWWAENGAFVGALVFGSALIYIFAKAIEGVHKDVRAMKDDLGRIKRHLGIREDWER